MKKGRNPKNRQKKTRAAAKAPVASQPLDRRQLLTRAAYALGGVAVLGGAAVYSVSSVRASMGELDLSKVGNGTPTIVQIHDPNCQLCTRLQRATRDALEAFDDDKLQYLVANIRTSEGATFAASFGVPHVTLILFDGDGSVLEVLNGVRDSEELQQTFTTHYRRSRLRS